MNHARTRAGAGDLEGLVLGALEGLLVVDTAVCRQPNQTDSCRVVERGHRVRGGAGVHHLEARYDNLTSHPGRFHDGCRRVRHGEAYGR